MKTLKQLMKKRSTRVVKNTVFLAGNHVYEAYEIDDIRGIIMGYKLFPSHGEPNAYRTFKTSNVTIKNLRS